MTVGAGAALPFTTSRYGPYDADDNEERDNGKNRGQHLMAGRPGTLRGTVLRSRRRRPGIGRLRTLRTLRPGLLLPSWLRLVRVMRWLGHGFSFPARPRCRAIPVKETRRQEKGCTERYEL